MKRYLIITFMMLGLLHAESEPVPNIETITEAIEDPCKDIVDAGCYVNENGEAVIIPYDPCEMFGGDACVEVPVKKSSFDLKVIKTLNKLNTYEVCVVDATSNKALKKCKKSFFRALKK